MGHLTNLETDFVSVAKIEKKARLVALGDASGYIKVVDLFGFERLERQRGHGGPVTSLYIEKDGSFISSGSGDGSIALWNLDVPEDLKQKHEKPPGFGEIIAMTSDKKSLITVAVSDGVADLWRYENENWRRELDLLHSTLEALGEDVFTPQQTMNNAGEFTEMLGPEVSLVKISPKSIAWLTRTGTLLWQSLSKAAAKPIGCITRRNGDGNSSFRCKSTKLFTLSKAAKPLSNHRNRQDR
jgi:WD40 repeat protein